MKQKIRHMQTYQPRRRRASKTLQWSQLKELKKLIDIELNTLILLKQTGTSKQIDLTVSKIEKRLTKYGTTLEGIGRDLGEGLPEVGRTYLKAIKQILGQIKGVIDPSLIATYRLCSQKIESQIALHLRDAESEDILL